jgi:hypothetical protein
MSEFENEIIIFSIFKLAHFQIFKLNPTPSGISEGNNYKPPLEPKAMKAVIKTM